MNDAPILALNETRKTLLASRLRVIRATEPPRLTTMSGAIRPGDGLWLEACEQVNTTGMPVPLDLLFLDADHRVVEKIVHVPPGVLSPKVPRAAGVLELPAGTIPFTRTEIGDRILIESILAKQAAS